ncbi:excisionase [Burkholderia sp. LMG 32019]|uniref:excisionase n=1 Tax=Burkholderia sp. LMG 32019 TaxID=3158173 RepID=UPI003C2EA81E
MRTISHSTWRGKMKIRLSDWLARVFNPVPAMRTASRWIKDGKIHPPPTRVGNAYYVEQNAVYQDNARTRPRSRSIDMRSLGAIMGQA